MGNPNNRYHDRGPGRRHPMGTKTRLRVNHSTARVCTTGKICYDKLEAENEAIRAMDAGRVNPGCHVEAYGCGECHSYHIGNRVIVFPPEDPVEDSKGA